MFLKKTKKNNMYKGVEDGDKYTQCHIILGSQQHLHTRKQEYTTSQSYTDKQSDRGLERQTENMFVCGFVFSAE